MLSFYIQGLTLGLAYVTPIGMQNLFVINSAMREKLWRVAATAFIHNAGDTSSQHVKG